MHAHFGSSLSLRSSHSHLHVSRARWALLLISSTSPFTSSPSSSSLWSPCCSYCPTPSTSLMSWINTMRTSAEDLRTLAENEPPTQFLRPIMSQGNLRRQSRWFKKIFSLLGERNADGSLRDMVVVGLITCERVVLGKSAKVLISWSAEGICPPHRGRWSWWAGGRTGW